MRRSWKRQADIVKRARFNSGLSQQRLADIMGLDSAQFVSNIERNMCGIPARDLARLTSALNITAGTLVDAMIEDYQDYLLGNLYEGLEAFTSVEKGHGETI